MKRMQWIAILAGSAVLAGCGTTVSQSQSHRPPKRHHAPPAVTASAPYPEKFVSHINLGERICVPSGDPYVTLDIATPHPQVQIDIGHPLTLTGAGFPVSAWTFTAHAGVVQVTVPVNVVFNMVPAGGLVVNGKFGNLHGDLFGAVLDNHGSLGLLFYAGSERPTEVAVLSRGPMSTEALSTWNLYSVNPKVEAADAQQAIKKAEAQGWSKLQQVTADTSVLGYDDGWLPLRSNQAYDLIDVTNGGSVIFREVAVTSSTPASYASHDPRACPAAAPSSS